jgi:iron complex outermembrane receptor protein
LFSYDSIEFKIDNNLKDSLSIGYEKFEDDYNIALFGCDITCKEDWKGAINFNNSTDIVNQTRIIGIEAKVRFY